MKRTTLLSIAMLFLFFTGMKAQFSDNFNAGSISPNWVGNGAYGLTQSGGVLSVKVSAVTTGSSFYVGTGGNINISANPVFNLKIKTNTVGIIKVTIGASDGTSAARELRVTSAVDSFVNYCLDFTSSVFTKTSVNRITFAVNDFVNGFGGTFTFEDLVLGTGAVKLASITPIRDITVYEAKTAQKIIVTDIANASGLVVSGAGALMSNITYSAITGGVCTISYDAGTAGTAMISVTATGTGGFSNNVSKFKLTVEANNQPTIDLAPNAKLAVGKAQPITITGISDGNSSVDQTVTVTAVSSAAAIIPNPTVTYINGSSQAVLTFTPASAGSATITVTVQDNGTVNNTKTMNFTINSYAGFNYYPTLDQAVNQSVYLSAGTLKVKLTGISDGDGGTQVLAITGTGKHAGVISAFSTSFTQGRDTAILTLTTAGLGKDTITVTVLDDGGNGTNNGDISVQTTFVVEVIPAPPTAAKIVLNTYAADTTAGLWSIEGNDVTQVCKYVDTLGSRWIRININQKMNWTGIWYNLPNEVNVKSAPYMSYRIMGSGFTPFMTHAYFWDTDTTRNTQGAHRQRDTISSGAQNPHTVFMDFRNPDDQINDKGVPMNMTRVARVLFNYHNRFLWPNNLVSGVVYISDVRIGDSCKSIPVINPICTVNPVPTITVWAGSGAQTVQLTGISNGIGTTAGVSLTATSSKPSFIPNPTLGALGADGKVTMTYTPGSATDSAIITFRVVRAGSTTRTITFNILAVSDAAASAVDINIDGSKPGQKVTGFGGFEPPSYLLDKYAQEQGCTFMRLTVDWGFEKNNDNGDPNVLNRDGFNKSLLDFNYIKKAYDAGVTDFFITLWAPPAWMMQSLSSVAIEGAPDWAVTRQKCDPIYYDEYIEYMVGIVRMIKEETGVEIAGFCPQNEPAFTEPYGSAILDPIHMAEICGKLGKRLADEGFTKVKTITSEQVFGQFHYAVTEYAAAAKADPLANQYCHVVGNHYPSNNASAWSAQFAACTTGTTYPKELWSTECTTNGNNFASVMGQMEVMIIGFNKGCGAWNVWGYNQGTSGNEDDLSKNEGMTFGYGTSKHFWAFKNWAKYVRKGAVQVKSTSANGSIATVAFYNSLDSTYSVIVLNKDAKIPYTVKFSGTAPATGYSVYRTSYYEKCVPVTAGKNGVYMIPPRSISSFVVKYFVNHAPTIDPITNKIIAINGSTTANMTGITCADAISQNITVTAVSSDPTLVANPTVTYTSPGTTGTLKIDAMPDVSGKVTITVTVKDNGGTANSGVDQTTTTFTVTINAGGGGGALADVSDKASVYPNPASDVINVTIPSELVNAKMTINNVSGTVMKEQQIAGDNASISVADLPAGMYMITVSNETSIAKLKFAKK